jgi:preprotein translocase subunit SecG
MSGKIVLIVVGSILLLLGVLLLVSSSNASWEVKEYKSLSGGKNAPENLKKITEVIGGVLTAGGLGLLGWGLAMHTGMTKHLAK